MKTKAAKSNLLKGVFASLLVVSGAGCDKSGGSYSLLAASQSFQQTTATVTNNQIDILWVIDNSFSMAPSQTNLLNNFNGFISGFVGNGYDFHLGVTTTDAYKAGAFFAGISGYATLRDGVFQPWGGGTHSGYPIIDKNTPNIVTNFVFNANQGEFGSGDERAFSSMLDTLSAPQNAAFHRPGAFLAIIIISDEDDFSDPTRPEGSWMYPGGIADHDYTNPNLMTSASILAQLDTFTGSAAATGRSYNVSAITVKDAACLASHQAAGAPSSIIGKRYMDLANQTNGILGSICDTSYYTALQQIGQKILELSTAFKLSRVPLVSSIKVVVNGISVPTSSTNGWTYDSVSNSLVFHGASIPPQGASISVNFDPLAPTF